MLIQLDQVFRSCKPSPSIPEPHYTRIKAVGGPITTHGLYGYGTVEVVTLLDDGRKVRRRAIKWDQPHESATTKDGQPRRSGYVREM